MLGLYFDINRYIDIIYLGIVRVLFCILSSLRIVIVVCYDFIIGALSQEGGSAVRSLDNVRRF